MIIDRHWTKMGTELPLISQNSFEAFEAADELRSYSNIQHSLTR